MTPEQLRTLFTDVASGRQSPHDALERLRHYPTEQLHFAQIDHLRPMVQGHPEVVFASGKTPEQVSDICAGLESSTGTFLATRTDAEQQHELQARFPRAEINVQGRTVFLSATPEPAPTGRGTVLIATAGTADLPVAEEAAVTARAFRNTVTRLTDVGVAGIHRVLDSRALLEEASVIVVVAGMEGALPSVIGGLVSVPIIAVPTSVGYGASLGGFAPLLAMLNSCVAGVTVVNIDNGFGAAAAASRINHTNP